MGILREPQKERQAHINTAAPIKRRRNIIAGLLSMVDSEHAHDFPAADWLKYAQTKLPARLFVPCKHCVKGGSKTLQVCIRTDFSMSVDCTNEDCDDYGYVEEYLAPARDQQDQLAKEGDNWLALCREYAVPPNPWLHVWIANDKQLTHRAASSTLKTMLRIYALVRKESRWTVDETRDWIAKTGWTHRDPPCLHDGDPVPVLLTIDKHKLTYIAKEVGLSSAPSVPKYLRMLRRLRLLRIAGRMEHGRIVYQAGWWDRHGEMAHQQPRWFINQSRKWRRRLQHVSSGHIRLQ